MLAQEGEAFEQQAQRLLAQGARGSMRDALSLTDQAIAFGSGQLQEATVRQMLGAVDRSHVFALLHALAAGNGRQLVETVDVLRIHGISAAGTLQELAALLQRMAVLQAVPGMELDPSDPDAPALQALATAMPADEIQLCYSIALHGQQELGLAPDEYAGLTMVLLRPLAFKAPQTDTATAALSVAATALAEKKTAVKPVAAQSAPAAVAPSALPPTALPAPPVPEAKPAPAWEPPHSAADQPPEAAAPTQAPPPQASSVPPWDDIPPDAHYGSPGPEPECAPPPSVAPAPAPAAVPPVEPAPPVSAPAADAAPLPQATVATTAAMDSTLGDFWADCVQQLIQAEAISALVRELALQAQLLAQDAQGWHLQVPRSSLTQEQTVQRLAAALAQAFACPGVQVQVGPVQDSPALRHQAQAQARQRGAEAIVANDAQVQALIAQYGATIVPGSIRPL